MFTGIIEELGKIAALNKTPGGAKITVAAIVVTGGTKDGDSIAVNGVCLTALDVREDSFAADVSEETLKISTLGGLKMGSFVNLERAVTPQTRLGGHIVQGHVDSRGKFLKAEKNADFWTVRIGFPAEFSRYLVYKGSVAVEGISLTVARLEDDFFEIAVIPKTWEMTNFSKLAPGDPVNLEADLIGKYVERMLTAAPSAGEIITREKLKDKGFI
ncbi:MAG: riboflavin synthase [Pyrinomonadaceae bacterium]|nr:riboflavin synthase [Pyrinomonadaceae bacterium]